MDEQELERMIVRIVGDVSGYRKSLTEAADATKDTAEKVEKEGKRVEGFLTSLKGYAQGALSALGAWGAKGLLKESFAAFEGREATVLKLNAALEANGRDVVGVTAEYRRFAKELSDVTTTSAGTTLAMLQQAESLGLTGDQAERAVRNATALAASQGGEAQEYLRMTAALEHGQVGRLGRYVGLGGHDEEGGGGGGAAHNAENVAKAQERLAKMFTVATAVGQTAQGQIQRLSNAWKGFKGDLGEFVAEGIGPVVGWLTQAVKWFRELSPEVKRTIVIVLGMTAAVFTLIAAVALFGVVVNTMFAGAGILIGLFVAAGVAIAAWVNKVGGVKQAWEKVQATAETAWSYIKAYAKAFLDWFMPKWNAFIDQATPYWEAFTVAVAEGWEKIKDAAAAFWDWVKPIAQAYLGAMEALWFDFMPKVVGLWLYLTSVVKDFVTWALENLAEVGKSVLEFLGVPPGVTADWDKVQDVVQRVFLGIEFGLRNLKEVWDVAWAGLQWLAVKALNAVLKNIFTIFSAAQIAPLFALFMVNWVGLWKGVYNYFFDVIKAIAKGMFNLFEEIRNAIVTQTFNIGAIVQKAFNETEFRWDANGLQVEGLDELEARLKKEFDDKAGNLGESFEDFVKRRRAEFAAAGLPQPQREDKENARKGGNLLGKEVVDGVKEATKDLDAVLFRSAEAVKRIREYKEQLAGTNDKLKAGNAQLARPGRPEVNVNVPAGPGGPMDVKAPKMEEILVAIFGEIKGQRNDFVPIIVNPGL